MRLFLGVFLPKVETTGTDFSGEVVAIGNQVTYFKKGDRIFGFNDSGLKSHAEYLIIDQNEAINFIPEAMNYIEAVAALEGVHYARNFVNKVAIQKGDKILINGASGAIGSALLQLAKYHGAHATAVCSTKNIDLMKKIGADEVIDYTKEDFTKKPEQYEFIFDAVGKSSFQKCKTILRYKGIYISSELGPWMNNLYLSIITRFMGDQKVVFPFPSNVKDSILFIKRLIKDGKYIPVIDRQYSLEAIDEAYAYVLLGHKKENVIITFDE